MFGEHGTPSSRKGLCISLRKNRGKSFWILGIPPLPPHSLALRASRILGFILTGSLCTTKSERIFKRTPTKQASPPPLAGTRHPAKKFSSLFLICAHRIFSSKRKRKLFCWVLFSTSRAAGLASIFCKNTAEFPPPPPSAVFLQGRTEILAATTNLYHGTFYILYLTRNDIFRSSQPLGLVYREHQEILYHGLCNMLAPQVFQAFLVTLLLPCAFHHPNADHQNT